MESRTQGSRPRLRTQKNSEAKDRPSWGQGQGHKSKCSQKKSLQKFFSGDLHLRKKKRSLQNFVEVSSFSYNILTVQKIVLSLSQGQDNFQGLDALRLKTSKCVFEDSTSDSNPISYLARFFWKKIQLHTPLINHCNSGGIIDVAL